MKKYLLAFALSGALCAFAPDAFAANMATEANGNDAPDNIVASGSIAEYVKFDVVDDSVDLGNLGGPTETNPEYTVADSAKIEGASNTHINVELFYGDNLTLDGAIDSLHAEPQPQLPTEFETQVKGTGMIDSLPMDDQVNYQNLGWESAPLAPYRTMIFTPGSLGIIIKAKVHREGLRDHYGQYSTDISLNWIKY